MWLSTSSLSSRWEMWVLMVGMDRCSAVAILALVLFWLMARATFCLCGLSVVSRLWVCSVWVLVLELLVIMEMSWCVIVGESMSSSVWMSLIAWMIFVGGLFLSRKPVVLVCSACRMSSLVLKVVSTRMVGGSGCAASRWVAAILLSCGMWMSMRMMLGWWRLMVLSILWLFVVLVITLRFVVLASIICRLERTSASLSMSRTWIIVVGSHVV